MSKFKLFGLTVTGNIGVVLEIKSMRNWSSMVNK